MRMPPKFPQNQNELRACWQLAARGCRLAVCRHRHAYKLAKSQIQPPVVRAFVLPFAAGRSGSRRWYRWLRLKLLLLLLLLLLAAAAAPAPAARGTAGGLADMRSVPQ